MTETESPQKVPTVQTNNEAQFQSDPLDTLAREFSQEAGKRVGAALADEIHNDPEARRAAATGAGVGLGVIAGLGLIALLTQ
ncbi:hypothetical protein [Halorubrum halodurans]|jgi:hypothetical protein|uniref:hypothetical protein n=1 Tax=Halorubrum halodurans TaxID=1383851 RepID=UPI001179AA79|nr:hypothetical protein [Halorubrum halodurans]